MNAEWTWFGDLYNRCVKRAKDCHDLDIQDRYNHYTFDFSQNVSIAHYSWQMGQIYFTTPRKTQLFGVHIDGEPKQINFLIDENVTIGLDGKKTNFQNYLLHCNLYLQNVFIFVLLTIT